MVAPSVADKTHSTAHVTVPTSDRSGEKERVHSHRLTAAKETRSLPVPCRRFMMLVTGEGLEPSTNGLTYLIGFHRPPKSSRIRKSRPRTRWFESLDYPFAIAGVPRLVSEAETDQGSDSCLLITQFTRFSNRHARRYQPRCGANDSEGRPSILRHSLFAVQLLPARGSNFGPRRHFKSVALPTELPGRFVSKRVNAQWSIV